MALLHIFGVCMKKTAVLILKEVGVQAVRFHLIAKADLQKNR